MEGHIKANKFLEEVINAQQNTKNAIKEIARFEEMLKLQNVLPTAILNNLKLKKEQLHEYIIRLKKLNGLITITVEMHQQMQRDVSVVETTPSVSKSKEDTNHQLDAILKEKEIIENKVNELERNIRVTFKKVEDLEKSKEETNSEISRLKKERDDLFNKNNELTQIIKDKELKEQNALKTNEETQQMHSHEIYLTIEEVYCGCQKMIANLSSNNTEEVFLVTFKKGIKEGEVIKLNGVEYVVKYLKHPFLSRRGDDLVVNKNVFLDKGVRHPALSAVFMKSGYRTLLSLKGFTEQGKTVFDDGSTTVKSL
ncbi:hypothetical protein EIN_453910 [Entamoeba invadens IP1]|uniref:Uncharacterized protein n=1 Tax=Entamoeba invadens IP1 TaxID=370355 RepID=L7FMQ9_ENTIV|nr:hypothetical protein EIN_453910 [Entamoeba invadens IP1]ELP89701.1 hypothetical protein EIN_453910 [Entamoeba invadens IP1]|eukprot:XP_004256472.1 hypothetical protein EIN_453910 [Entamoeba invadens IP1]